MRDLRNKFEDIGGVFLIPAEEIAQKLQSIKAFIFDWDGVFNNGMKSAEKGSTFSEADSMGINMLRFNHWRIKKEIPGVAIISGENNNTAIDFANREHFDAVYINSSNKKKVLQLFSEKYAILFSEMAFVFDDILDVSASSLCNLSFCVRRNASPLFQDYIIANRACDYITGSEGGHHAVREITELIIGLSGNYNETISKRIEFGDEYKKYLAQRNMLNTVIETSPNNQ